MPAAPAPSATYHVFPVSFRSSFQNKCQVPGHAIPLLLTGVGVALILGAEIKGESGLPFTKHRTVVSSTLSSLTPAGS